MRELGGFKAELSGGNRYSRQHVGKRRFHRDLREFRVCGRPSPPIVPVRLPLNQVGRISHKHTKVARLMAKWTLPLRLWRGVDSVTSHTLIGNASIVPHSPWGTQDSDT